MAQLLWKEMAKSFKRYVHKIRKKFENVDI